MAKKTQRKRQRKRKFSERLPRIKIRFKFETDELTFFPSVGIDFGFELLSRRGLLLSLVSRRHSYVESKLLQT